MTVGWSVVRGLSVVVTLGFGSGAMAQDVVFSPDVTRACLANPLPGADLSRCVGVAAEQCMQDTPGGESTVGMGNCLYAESQWWAAEIETVYAELMAVSREMDGLNGPYAPSQAEALMAYRAAWEAYRGAKCEYVLTQWGGGTGGGPALVNCTLEENAGFYQDLKNSLLQ